MPVALSFLQEDYERLADATHRDPFAVLGRHRDPDGVWRVRVFRPDASQVALAAQGCETQLVELAPGLYCGPAPAPPADYQLRVTTSEGQEDLAEDAYRFGLVIGSEDAISLRLGRLWRADEVLGAHACQVQTVEGVRFAVWAPNARRVAVVGAWNGWDPRRNPMRYRHEIGVWEFFQPGVQPGTAYAFDVLDAQGAALRRDPYARALDPLERPAAALVAPPSPARAQEQAGGVLEGFVAILALDAAAEGLATPDRRRHVLRSARDLGFTHLHLRSVHSQEHGWPAAWMTPGPAIGGEPGLRAFLRAARATKLQVLVDWPVACLPQGPHGLASFDGTAMYEPADATQARAAPSGALRFNFARFEAANLLLSAALRWVEDFGVDGLIVPSLAPLLRFNHPDSREPLARNGAGGAVDTGALEWLRCLSELLAERRPGAALLTLDGDDWFQAAHPTVDGGLGLANRGRGSWPGLLGDASGQWRALLGLESGPDLCSVEHWPGWGDAAHGERCLALALLWLLAGWRHAPWQVAQSEPGLLRRLNRLGAEHPGLQAGAPLHLLAQPNSAQGVLAFSRGAGAEQLVVVAQLDTKTRATRCPAPGSGRYAVLLDSADPDQDTTPASLHAELDVRSPSGFSFATEIPPRSIRILAPRPT